ncbi:RNA-dependent RNA polymerase [Beihai narna-like virus 13]|uniref:RNA-dependent RNA polymerase n=1 Tax=Beihai narna-like virus 13 TaxID=1922440 RepID=UPI000909FFA2|nr:RNA-dependent RNA polymerase [Beihai narna-like virus 13]APG77068.1 RNA-dependent RNA polymerase [Beihai narna-like virus 13]
MAKIFKLSIHTFFSKCTDQLLPEDHHKSVQIIHPDLEIYLKKWARVRQLSFLQDLLMCKGLANPVPDEMILQSYIDHRQTLSSVGESPEGFLMEFKKVLRTFGEGLRKNFDGKTVYPSETGYLGFTRSKGGLRTALKGQFRPKGFRKRLGRIDPIVLHLEGLPGIGKSKISLELGKRISKAFGFNYNDMYNRTINCDHWDGYRGQLISSIDDFGCSFERQSSDYGSLIQLCSEQEMVLPMADLKEKGRKFSSEFLFLSTNGLTTCPTYNIHTVNTFGSALLRRVSPTFKLERGPNYSYRMLKKEYSVETERWNQVGYWEGDWLKMVSILESDLLSRFDKKFGNIFQPCTSSSFGEVGYGFYFPSNPPDRLPECEAHAIAEPLKVRLITKNEPNTWVLKPVQLAMWKTLKNFKVFSLTHGPTIDLSRLGKGGRYLVSGDYKSATDRLHFDIMQTAVNVLKDYIPEELRSWFLWEGGKHIINYPKNTLLEPIVQSRGQLMGSLLSFPILCLANFTTYAMARLDCFPSLEIEDILNDENISCFINGDDILFTCDGKNSMLYNRWKHHAKSIGLELSVGKTYISKYFGLINSQMILAYPKVQDKAIKKLKNVVQVFNNDTLTISTIPCLVQLLEGKIRSYSKIQNYGSLDFSQVLTYVKRETIVNLNRKKLDQTPESLDLPKELGGIGVLKEGYKPTLKDKEVYIFKALRHRPKIIQRIDESLLICRVPMRMETRAYSTSAFHISIKPYHGFVEEEEEPEFPPIFPWVEFRKFLTWYKKTKIREIINDLDLFNCPSLDQFKSYLRITDLKTFRRLEAFASHFLCEDQVPNEDR